MLVFAYKLNNNLINNIDNLKLNNIVLNKDNDTSLNLNKYYYEDNMVRDIKDKDLMDYYKKKESLVVELDYYEFDLIESVLKEFQVVNREIQYSIISTGTEKFGSKGYMSISKKINGSKYLLVQNHNERFITGFKDSLKCLNYKTENIAFSRFELIGALSLKENKFKDNIVICGLGNIGITTLIYLLDNNYKNIDVYTNDFSDYVKEGISLLNSIYGVNINLIGLLDKEYNTYIDTTGVSSVLEKIFNNIKYNKTIFLIGTPRESKYLIDPLLIHRHNLKIVGAHELNGISKIKRQNLFLELLQNNENKLFLNNIVTISKYEENIIERKLENKSNFIEVIEYDN